MASFSAVRAQVLDREGGRRHYATHLMGLNAYDRHKKFMNDYVLHYGKAAMELEQKRITKTDQDTLRETYRFIRTEEDDDSSWEQRLAKRYYNKLFKEYCIADMGHYKDGKIGMRWRSEKEVVCGKEAKVRNASINSSTLKEEPDKEDDEEEEEIYDLPRLICCFGEAMNDFVPTVLVSRKRQDPDIYSTWKMLQWKPPEFARILGGPSFNMAIALSRQGCRVALMGKVGDDKYGRELVHTLNINKVQTRGVRFDSKVQTGISQLNLLYEDGKARMSCVQPSAENSLMESDINVDILKEALIFHFTSSILTTEPIRSSLFTALRIFKSYEGDTFFDLNLPLPLWISREHTWSVIKDAWFQANFIEVTKHELEFLLGEENCKRNPPQYAVTSDKEDRPLRDEYHYTRQNLATVWHDNLKMLIVTDGTYVIHYYTPEFDGEVLGVEDVIVAAYTCDRAGSADAIVAGVIRKLNLHPEIYKDEVTLPKALRYAMSAGVIAQWTPGSTKGLPTESAAQNLTEQLYHPIFVQSIGTELYATRTEEYLL